MLHFRIKISCSYKTLPMCLLTVSGCKHSFSPSPKSSPQFFPCLVSTVSASFRTQLCSSSVELEPTALSPNMKVTRSALAGTDSPTRLYHFTPLIIHGPTLIAPNHNPSQFFLTSLDQSLLNCMAYPISQSMHFRFILVNLTSTSLLE